MRKDKSQPVGKADPQLTVYGAVLHLTSLCDMHPCLPPDMAGVMVLRAALGLQRNKHSPGASLQLDIERALGHCVLRWAASNLGTARQHDHNRITEDGAEAIALAAAHKAKAWRVVRRMQREEHADWLLEHQNNGARELVAFEVSGVDQGSIAPRLHEKLGQVAKSVDVDQRCAGVVGFEQPEAALRSVEVQTHAR